MDSTKHTARLRVGKDKRIQQGNEERPTERLVLYIARSPDEEVAARFRDTGWHVAISKTLADAASVVDAAPLAAGFVDLSGFASQDWPALEQCLRLHSITWIATATAAQMRDLEVQRLISSYCMDYVTLPLPHVTDRRNRAGDDRHNEASWNGPETRFRRVSRMRFFAGFCNGNFALESMIPTQRDRAFRANVTDAGALRQCAAAMPESAVTFIG